MYDKKPRSNTMRRFSKRFIIIALLILLPVIGGLGLYSANRAAANYQTDMKNWREYTIKPLTDDLNKNINDSLVVTGRTKTPEALAAQKTTCGEVKRINQNLTREFNTPRLLPHPMGWLSTEYRSVSSQAAALNKAAIEKQSQLTKDTNQLLKYCDYYVQIYANSAKQDEALVRLRSLGLKNGDRNQFVLRGESITSVCRDVNGCAPILKDTRDPYMKVYQELTGYVTRTSQINAKNCPLEQSQPVCTHLEKYFADLARARQNHYNLVQNVDINFENPETTASLKAVMALENESFQQYKAVYKQAYPEVDIEAPNFTINNESAIVNTIKDRIKSESAALTRF